MAKRLQLITNVAFIATVMGTSAAICGILLLILLIYLLTSREGLPLIRLYSILGLALFSMSLIFCLVAFVVPVDGTLDEVISLSLSDICWSLGTVVCYLLWVVRMKYCFLNTPYQPSIMTYKCMYIGIGLFFLFQMIMVLLLVLWQANVINSSFLDLYDEINIAIKSLNHTVVSIALIYLFVSRLMRITVEVSEDDNYEYDRQASYNRDSKEYLKHDMDSLISSNEIKIRSAQPDLTDLQKSLIHIITKYTVLFSTMVIMTEIYILFDVILSGVLLANEKENITLATWDIKWFLLGIDCCVMSISLLLTFEFADKYYNLLCKLSHSYCKVCFASKAKKENINL